MPHRVQSPKRSRGATIGLVIAILLGVAILLLNVFTYVLHIARYYGDSMEPSLHNGQTLVIRRTGKVSAGDVIAFYYNNKLLVRRDLHRRQPDHSGKGRQRPH